MTSKYVFILGSSVEPFQHKTFSVYDPETRFQQTLESIASIKSKVPHAYICLVETSNKAIDMTYRDQFRELMDYYAELWDDEVIKYYYELCENFPGSSVYIKSLFETYGLLKVLKDISEKNLFIDARRIFKLTSRYLLNEKFQISDYESKFLDHYVITKVHDYSVTEDSIVENSPEQYLYKYKGMIETGFWSFGKYQFGNVASALRKSLLYLEEMMKYTTGSDIEHALYHYMDRKIIMSVPELGVTVRKGFEGTVSEK